MIKNIFKIFFGVLALAVFAGSVHAAANDMLVKDREAYKKPIRFRMPPQILIDTLQKELNSRSPKWGTFWQNFVVEDDPLKDEFLIIARSEEKNWSFGLDEKNCPKPVNYDQLMLEAKGPGTPLRLDVMIGVKRKRSWFRYIVTVYRPIYKDWTSPCTMWSLPPGKSGDRFYRENYTMKVYAENMQEKIYQLAEELKSWSPPKKSKEIPAIRGSGKDIIGEDAETLTDEEKALPLDRQKKIVEERRKAREAAEKEKKR